MRFFKLFLLAVVLIAVAGAGVMWYMAGSEDGPTITIHSPDKYIGRSTPLAISIASETELAGTVINIEQNGKPVPLAEHEDGDAGCRTGECERDDRDAMGSSTDRRCWSSTPAARSSMAFAP